MCVPLPQRRYLLVPRNPTTEERFEDYFDRLFRALANLRYCLFNFPIVLKMDYVEVFEGDPDFDQAPIIMDPLLDGRLRLAFQSYD